MRRPEAHLIAAALAAALVPAAALADCPCGCAGPPAAAAAAPAEQPAIAEALHRHVDRLRPADPTALEVAQIAVDSGYSIVAWVHGEEAGESLLRRDGGAWRVTPCGPGWLGLPGACHEEVPAEVVARLFHQLDPARLPDAMP
jgi:hypothetical protein